MFYNLPEIHYVEVLQRNHNARRVLKIDYQPNVYPVVLCKFDWVRLGSNFCLSGKSNSWIVGRQL